MVNVETIIVVAAVDEAVAVEDMEEDVVDATPTTPILKILTVSSHSSLP